METQPVLPDRQRFARYQCGQAGDRGGLPGDEIRLLTEPRGGPEHRPVDAGRLRGEVATRPGIVRLVDILAVDQAFLDGRHLRLQRDDARGAGIGIGKARQRHDLRDIGPVCLADLDHRRVGRQIIIAVVQSQPALQHVRHRHRRRIQRLRHVQADDVRRMEIGRVERIDIDADVRAQHPRQVALVLQRRDRGEIGLERRQAARLDPGGVHIGGVIIRDLTSFGARRGVRGAGVGDDRRVALFSQQRGGEERTDRGAVGGDHRLRAPCAIGIGLEIVARLHLRIDRGAIDPGGQRLGGGGCRGEQGREGDGTFHDGLPFFGEDRGHGRQPLAFKPTVMPASTRHPSRRAFAGHCVSGPIDPGSSPQWRRR